MKLFVSGGRQAGKTLRWNQMVEQALDDGHTVIMPNGDARGANTARDVTPPKPKQIIPQNSTGD